MFRQLMGRLACWRRRLRVDRRSLRPLELFEYTSTLYDLVDDGSEPRAADLLRVILRQALTDQALAIHLFFDDADDCMRMLYCLAVPPGTRTVVPRSAYERCAEAAPPGQEDLMPYKEEDVLGAEPPDQTWERVWFEMVPPPKEVAPRLFRRALWHAGVKQGATAGTLYVSYEAGDRAFAVCAPRPDDIRIYLGDERPPVRPKLARHFEELGLPVPESG